MGYLCIMSLFKHIIKWLLLNVMFWWGLFLLSRILFFIVNANFLSGTSFVEIVSVFYHALSLDISTICYILVLPFFIMIFQIFFQKKWIDKIQFAYVLLILLVYVGIVISETAVYPEWKSKLNYKSLLYLSNPKEIMRTASTLQLIIGLVAWLVITGLMFFSYVKVFYQRYSGKQNILITFVSLIIVPSLLFLGMRGGAQPIPINQSRCYFSSSGILNQVAVNPAWNLLHSYVQNKKSMGKNPFVFMPQSKSDDIVQQLYHVEKDTTIKIFNTTRPNIVVFVLEGWSADLIESCGGEPGITPYFHELEKSGILFTQCFSSGTRSQQGMSSIFSGFPAHPITTITEQPEKCVKLPKLAQILNDNSYKTSYYFGGDITYGNIKSYLIDNGFQHLMDESEFPKKLPSGSLGIHDEFTFPYFCDDLGKYGQPFFSALFTMSTHSPYDMNFKPVLQWPKIEKEYTNAAYYSDGCFRKFFELAKTKPWYANTVFVFISDHGHSSYRDWNYFLPDYHKIVFMICGEPVKEEYRGLKINKIASQVDFASTILKQLQIDNSAFKWSKDLFNPYCPEFAYYSFEEGLGWVRPGASYAYDARFNSEPFFKKDSTCRLTDDQIRMEGKAYLQKVFQEYLNY